MSLIRDRNGFATLERAPSKSYREGLDELMNELRAAVDPNVFERGRVRFDRDFKFLIDRYRTENDYNLAVERLVFLHFGVIIEPSIVTYGPVRGRFGQRFGYLHAMVGAAYFEYEPFGAELAGKIRHLYEGVDLALVRSRQAAFERDLAFLVEAARSKPEVLYALEVLAKLHLDEVVRQGGELGRNQELRQRLEHIFEQHRNDARRAIPRAA